jgi:polysaccharide biosynthesis/export protein
VRFAIFVLATGISWAAGAALSVIAAESAKVLELPTPLPVDQEKYQIGPEDLLFIRVWREPDFTLPVAVRPDGKITMPLIGEVRAAGQSPLQLTAALKLLLTQYLNNPDVSVFVTEVRSKKFYIDGEVNRPGSFALVTPTTVLEALSRSGGFREFANSKKIRVLRGGQIRRFNYKEVTNGKHLEQNIAVESGDHIIVP